MFVFIRKSHQKIESYKVLLFLVLYCLLSFFVNVSPLSAEYLSKVLVGVDLLFTKDYIELLRGKRIGLIANHTAVNAKLETTINLLKFHAKSKGYHFTALFAPEHGMNGSGYATEAMIDETDPDGIPIYSLYGKTLRPTDEMLSKVDVLIYDIQDIGSRSYTYISTLFFAMEEAAKKGTTVVVLDRPNPINGLIVDGPMLEDKWRSIVGYINVPYCHGMTIGELACLFNEEYRIGCKLHVVPMKGWKRSMTFQDTALPWIPTSPYIPESSTTYYYPTTGIIGELQVVNIGIGYTLPFKVIGAPWIDAKLFAQKLNEQKFSGVFFHPFYYRPFYGRFAKEICQGVQIVITDLEIFKPVMTQYLILGMIKSLYPQKFKEAMEASCDRKTMFCKVNGTEDIYRILKDEPYVVWKLKEFHQKEREAFKEVRMRYLLKEYQ